MINYVDSSIHSSRSYLNACAVLCDYHSITMHQTLWYSALISLHSSNKKNKNVSVGGLSSLLRHNLLSVLVVANARWGGTVAATFARADTDNLPVDGAGHAVLQLQIHLRYGVL